MALNIDRRYFQQLGRLEFLAKQAVEGFITGLHKSPFHGFSVEFAEHRLYNKGESTRHIDWKLYARTEKLFTKRYEEETNLRCQLVIDHSSSMYYPGPVSEEGNQFNKIKFSVYAAAALIELFKRQRDAVGLSLFADELDVQTKARSSQAHHRYLYTHLEELLNTVGEKEQSKTFAVDALHAIAEQANKRSLVIIFSDMLDNSGQADELFDALQHLRHNKHEVILFHVVDKKTELDFDFDNRPMTFVDLESGDEIKANPVDIRDTYLEQMSAFHQELKVRCGQNHIDFIEADINAGVNPILMEYMIKRQKLY
ncbi:DUF58 domain-containing protein [Sanyastnella coralliicola]|uniref:DUF58 domain-containing protein n=1 Tax=Sanyastnella coralliicola TaxID=3069118 RepID=UPI0027B8C4EA|nr:DUF58 domain-containing protein [Longitalea sp. SCSIO 12813]